MCISCDMKELNRLHASASEALVDSLVEITHDLMRFVTGVKPVLSDAHQAAALDLLSRADRVMRGAQAAPAPEAEATTLDREGLAKMLAEAFPGAKVVIGTPEEIEASIEQLTSGKKPN